MASLDELQKATAADLREFGTPAGYGLTRAAALPATPAGSGATNAALSSGGAYAPTAVSHYSDISPWWNGEEPADAQLPPRPRTAGSRLAPASGSKPRASSARRLKRANCAPAHQRPRSAAIDQDDGAAAGGGAYTGPQTQGGSPGLHRRLLSSDPRSSAGSARPSQPPSRALSPSPHARPPSALLSPPVAPPSPPAPDVPLASSIFRAEPCGAPAAQVSPARSVAAGGLGGALTRRGRQPQLLSPATLVVNPSPPRWSAETAAAHRRPGVWSPVGQNAAAHAAVHDLTRLSTHAFRTMATSSGSATPGASDLGHRNNTAPTHLRRGVADVSVARLGFSSGGRGGLATPPSRAGGGGTRGAQGGAALGRRHSMPVFGYADYFLKTGRIPPCALTRPAANGTSASGKAPPPTAASPQRDPAEAELLARWALAGPLVPAVERFKHSREEIMRPLSAMEAERERLRRRQQVAEDALTPHCERREPLASTPPPLNLPVVSCAPSQDLGDRLSRHLEHLKLTAHAREEQLLTQWLHAFLVPAMHAQQQASLECASSLGVGLCDSSATATSG